MTYILSVGAARFELATSCSQSRRDNRTTLRPVIPFFPFLTTILRRWGCKDRICSIHSKYFLKNLVKNFPPPIFHPHFSRVFYTVCSNLLYSFYTLCILVLYSFYTRSSLLVRR